jgi:hypothetical protein
MRAGRAEWFGRLVLAWVLAAVSAPDAQAVPVQQGDPTYTALMVYKLEDGSVAILSSCEYYPVMGCDSPPRS